MADTNFWCFLMLGNVGVFTKIITRYIDPKSAAIYEVLGGVVFGFIVAFFVNFKIATHPLGVSLALLAGFLGFFGSFLFLYAVNKGPLSIIVTLSALYPVLTITLAVLFLGETITMKQGLGIVLALVSMALISS